jgi:hypothetical protein
VSQLADGVFELLNQQDVQFRLALDGTGAQRLAGRNDRRVRWRDWSEANQR